MSVRVPNESLVLLSEAYRARLATRARDVIELLQRLELGDPAAGAELRQAAHRLAGSGGTHGFPEITRAGRAVEEAHQADLSARGVELVRTLQRAGEAPERVHPHLGPGSERWRVPLGESRGRLLLVEDEPDTAALLAGQLQQERFEVLRYADATAALGAFGRGGVSVCVLDVQLAGDVDGFTLLARLRAFSRTVPILMLTAREREDDVLRAFELGADDYVTKPFRPRELVARIERMLRGARLRARIAPEAPGVLRGALGGARLRAVVEMLAHAGQHGRLWVHGHEASGYLDIAAGRLLAARSADEQDDAAALTLLAARAGAFEFVPGSDELDTPPTGTPLEVLLVELAARSSAERIPRAG